MRAGWIVGSLGDVCEIRNGSTPAKTNSAFWTDGDVPWFTIDDMRDQGRRIASTRRMITRDALAQTSVKLLPPETVLLCCTASVGEYAFTEIALTTNQQFNGLVVRDKAVLLPRFLLYFVSSLKDTLLGISGKTTVDFIPISRLKDICVPLPPLDYQERIVAILDEAFEGIAAAKANTEKSHQSLSELENAAGFPPEPIFGKKRHTLTELCELIVDCEHKTAPVQETGIPSIRTPNIGRGFLILDGVNRVSEEAYRYWTRRAEPTEGDLIFAREAPAGNVAVVPPETKMCLGQRTVLLRPKRNLVNSGFLAHLILHPATQARWVGHSRGATVQHVNLKDIRALPIGALPSLQEQAVVVARIGELTTQRSKAADNYSAKLAALDSLRQSLLHQAFSGNL